MNNKDMRQLVKRLEAQGFTVKVSRKGHVLVGDPGGRRVSTISGTPSDPRAWKNAIAELKRAGFDPDA